MRTTVTLEKDVERMLRDAMHRTRKGFKETLNDAIRRGLASSAKRSRSKPFQIKARVLGLKAGIDPTRFNKLADKLEVAEFRSELPPRP
ncbi:MAG: antitoxin [Verrucomicrobia bacterium]|nr:antitoxin [Verrucomicrobiota bacterium]